MTKRFDEILREKLQKTIVLCGMYLFLDISTAHLVSKKMQYFTKLFDFFLRIQENSLTHPVVVQKV